MKKNEYRDTGEQLRWFIENMSTTERLKRLEAKITVATSEEKKILQAAEKGRMLDDRPASLTTAIPRRKWGGWDEHDKNKRSKVETVDAALSVMNGSSENALQEIHKFNMKRGHREKRSNSDARRKNIEIRPCRIILGDITNKTQEIENDEQLPKEEPMQTIVLGEHVRYTKTAIICTKRKIPDRDNPEIEQIIDLPPQKAARNNNTTHKERNEEVIGGCK